jgi:hypothetical protein
MLGNEVASLQLILMGFDMFSRPKLRVSYSKIQIWGMECLSYIVIQSAGNPSWMPARSLVEAALIRW